MREQHMENLEWIAPGDEKYLLLFPTRIHKCLLKQGPSGIAE